MALIRSGYGPHPSKVERPVVVDLAGQRLPLDIGLLYVSTHRGASQVLFECSTSISTGITKEGDGYYTFTEESQCVEWFRYLIEQAHTPSRYRFGACWLDEDDYPEGKRFKRWLEDQ